MTTGSTWLRLTESVVLCRATSSLMLTTSTRQLDRAIKVCGTYIYLYLGVSNRMVYNIQLITRYFSCVVTGVRGDHIKEFDHV